MRPVVFDAETFFDSKNGYTLKRQTTEEYIRDPRFELDGAAIKWSPSTNPQWYDRRDLEYLFKNEDWSDVYLICHHTNFDGFILNHHYGVKPKMYGCTLSMARHMLGNHVSVSLDSVRAHFGIPSKSTPYPKMDGRHWQEMDEATRFEVAQGAIDEVNSIWNIFNRFMQDGFPVEELHVVDAVVRMFCDPCLIGDSALLGKVWQNEALRKQQAHETLGVTAEELQSADRFAELLRQAGVEPETKTSPKGNEIYAFAKNDDFMRGLLEHENDHIRALAEARLGEKSSLLQTRAATLGWMASRGPLPVYLRYSGAGTLRFSGGDSVNWQNFKRGSDIRRSICAPEGYLLAPIDLSQVEVRVLAWLAGCQTLLDTFRANGDPYSEIATKFYGRPVSKATPDERGTGKQTILSCGYGSGAKKFQATAKLGIYGPPVELSLQESQTYVDLYRNTYPEIPRYWRNCEWMLGELYNGREQQWGITRLVGDFNTSKRRIVFPNGCQMVYDSLIWREPDEKEKEIGKRAGWYVKTRQGWKSIYGSMMAQNMCEAISRIIMTQALLRIQNQLKLRVVNSTHDELLVLIPKDGREKQHLQDCIAEMTREPAWLPGIPLAAEGALGDRYEK